MSGPKPRTVKAPTVHLNGTSEQALCGQLEDAHTALERALDAMNAAAPNARDYYSQGPEAFGVASLEHVERVARVESVQKELHAIWEAIHDKRESAEVSEHG